MKIRKYSIIVLLIAIVCCMGNLKAQANEEDFASLNYRGEVKKTGTSAAAFLEIGVGARAQSMGGAYVAISNDISGSYWNPAGVSLINTLGASANHSNWLGETSYEYFGIVFPVASNMSFGLSLTSLDYGQKQPVRTIIQPEGTGEYYSASDIAIAATFGMNVTYGFSFGVTGKYIEQNIWHESANTFAFDLGIHYKTDLEGLTMGASISNFGGDLKMEGRDLIRAYDSDEKNYSNDKLNVTLQTDEFPLPLIFRFGLAYQFLVTENHKFILTSDLIHPSNNVVSLNSGFEYTALKVISLRGGYESIFDDMSEKGLTLGVGFRNPFSEVLDFTIDYAYSDFGILGYVQRFSLDISL